MIGLGLAMLLKDPALRARHAFQPALLVDVDTQAAAVGEFLRQTGRKLVRAVDLFEVYRGEHVPEGKKSLNFTVTLGADDRTLSDKDESKFLDKVRKNAAQIGAELRG